jgi:hypothetical protein
MPSYTAGPLPWLRKRPNQAIRISSNASYEYLHFFFSWNVRRKLFPGLQFGIFSSEIEYIAESATSPRINFANEIHAVQRYKKVEAVSLCDNRGSPMVPVSSIVQKAFAPALHGVGAVQVRLRRSSPTPPGWRSSIPSAALPAVLQWRESKPAEKEFLMVAD